MGNSLPDDRLFDLKGLAKYSTLGASTIRDDIASENLPCFKVRGKLLFRKGGLDSWLDSFRVTTDIDQIAKKALDGLGATDT